MKRNATKLAALLGGLIIAVGLFAAPTHADEGDGIITPNVVGGTPAAQGEFPWVVHLSMGCGGSFIRQDIILTAAHCVSGTGNNTSIRVEYGNVNLGSGTTVNSKYVWDSGSTGNDWALIQLQSKVTNAPLIALGNTSHDNGNFTIMGWGATSEGGGGSNRLLKATVPFVADDVCDDYYGSRLNKTTEICAGFAQGGTDTCQGDSGGPMVKSTASGFVQTGIVSWGDGCARPNAYGIYAQVSHFASAINAKADELSGGTPPSGCSRTNGTDFAINDNATITSTIAVSGCTGNASATSTVAVNIIHTYIGDLKVDLIAPDGSVYVLHNRSGGSADNINRSYTVNLSSEPRNGTWRLRVNDNANADTGRLDTWTVNL